MQQNQLIPEALQDLRQVPRVRVLPNAAPDERQRLGANAASAPALEEVHPVVVTKQGRWRQAEHPQHLPRQLLPQPLTESALVNQALLQQELPVQPSGFERLSERALICLL